LAGGQRVLSIALQAVDTVSSIFAPVSTPAVKEADLAKMVLGSGLIVKHHGDAGATVPARAPAAAPAPRAAVVG